MKTLFAILAMTMTLISVAKADSWYGDEAYLRCNPDVRRSLYENGGMTPYEHYIRHGQYENRLTDGRCFASDAPYWFSESCYLTKYPDIRRAVYNGQFFSGWHHYRFHGQYEGRSVDCR